MTNGRMRCSPLPCLTTPTIPTTPRLGCAICSRTIRCIRRPILPAREAGRLEAMVARPPALRGERFHLCAGENDWEHDTVEASNFDRVKDLNGGRIYCGWHGHSFIPAHFFRKRGYWVIISHSRDGETQKRIFAKLGYNIIRGSTGRGGVRALIEAIRALRNGATMAITPDGPRGPS